MPIPLLLPLAMGIAGAGTAATVGNTLYGLNKKSQPPKDQFGNSIPQKKIGNPNLLPYEIDAGLEDGSLIPQAQEIAKYNALVPYMTNDKSAELAEKSARQAAADLEPMYRKMEEDEALANSNALASSIAAQDDASNPQAIAVLSELQAQKQNSNVKKPAKKAKVASQPVSTKPSPAPQSESKGVSFNNFLSSLNDLLPLLAAGGLGYMASRW